MVCSTLRLILWAFDLASASMCICENLQLESGLLDGLQGDYSLSPSEGLSRFQNSKICGANMEDNHEEQGAALKDYISAEI